MTLELVLGSYVDDPSQVFLFPLEKAPHMLVAGMTGSGKSVFVNSLLVQLLKLPTSTVRLLLLDPKRVEMAPYARAPHLLEKPVWSPTDMMHALYWLDHEMDERFEMLADAGVRSLDAYNNSLRVPAAELPYIVCVVDELANVVIDNKEAETMLVSIATMGRAAGIHLILATQSPRADVLTGLIRANVPTRIAFATATQMESKIILEEPGAEELPGKGSMLARVAGSRRLEKLQGEMVTDIDVERAVDQAVARTW